MTAFTPKADAFDGVEYESDRVHFGGGSSSQQVATDMVFKYRIGHDVSVYYDPDDPSIAVLDRKMTLSMGSERVAL